MFQIRNVTKKYGNEYALNDVSFNLEKGMNFILGSSGSGKTTLLKIISGFDKDFDGDVTFCQKNLKSLNEHEKSYIYNNIFGFVWQDFNLISNLTVYENILIPEALKNNISRNKAEKIMSELDIMSIKDQKVKLLSGGQKQRVAIARELMKTPDVIICDEPTSALDSNTAKATMEILRKLARLKTVIIVTHDTSLVQNGDNVITLDKGEIENQGVVQDLKTTKLKMGNAPKLKFSKAGKLASTSIKRNLSRVAICVVAVLLSSLLMLTAFGGTISGNAQKEYDDLLSTYGESVLDITIHNAFMSAGGTGGETDDSPNVDVDQDINGLFYKYENDPRIDFSLIMQTFNNITVDYNNKEYSVKKTSNVPVFNGLLSGRHPKNDEFEVIVPKAFPALLGKDNQSILGEKITFNCALTTWEGNKPIYIPSSIELTIVGVFDSTEIIHYDNGETYTFDVTDSFFMGAKPTSQLRENVGMNGDALSFVLRANSPESMISLKNEFNKNGIVPMGRFELIEDIVKLNEITAVATSQATIIIAVLSAMLALSVFAITAFLRLKEYAIFKTCGFGNSSIARYSLMECAEQATFVAVLLIVLSPLWNLLSKLIFGIPILNLTTIFVGMIIMIVLELLNFAITSILSRTAKVNSSLKGGSR